MSLVSVGVKPVPAHHRAATTHLTLVAAKV